MRAYGGDRIAELYGPWTAESLSFSHAVGRYGDHVYAFFDVTDDRVVYCARPSRNRLRPRAGFGKALGGEVQRYARHGARAGARHGRR